MERISSELETPATAFGWLRGALSMGFDSKEGWGRGYLKEGGVEEGQRESPASGMATAANSCWRRTPARGGR